MVPLPGYFETTDPDTGNTIIKSIIVFLLFLSLLYNFNILFFFKNVIEKSVLPVKSQKLNVLQLVILLVPSAILKVIAFTAK